MIAIDSSGSQQIGSSGVTSGLRKIYDTPKPCTNPGHSPPSHIVLPPGGYEHTCPGCGEKAVFEVERATL